MELFQMYEQLGLRRAVWERGEAVLADLAQRFRGIDQIGRASCRERVSSCV